MAWLDPTDETDVGTAPDGRIYLDRARCYKKLREKLRGETIAWGFFSLGCLLLLAVGILFLHTIVFNDAKHLFFRLYFGGFAFVLIALPISAVVVFLRNAILYAQVLNGYFQVITDEVVRVRQRREMESYKRLWWIFTKTDVYFRNSRKIILRGDIPIDVINTRDTFYIVRAGKSTRSRRIDLCFDTRKYVWKD